MMAIPFRSLSAGALFVLASALLAPAAQAASFTVTKTADTLDGTCDSDCSLREAVQAANALPGEDTVLVGPGVYILTRTGAFDVDNLTGDLNVKDRLILVGAGADLTILDGGGTDRVLDASGQVGLEVRGVTIRNGRAPGRATPFPGFSGSGGGIVGDVTVVDSVITGNEAAGTGGGLSSFVATIRNSTISNNVAADDGGGLYSILLRMDNVTVSGNRTLGQGGGIKVSGEDQELSHVTVAGNQAAVGGGIHLSTFECPGGPCPYSIALNHSVVAGNTGGAEPDCVGLESLSGGSYNAYGVRSGCGSRSGDRGGTAANPLDPKLGPLADNGGPTPTHLPLPGSPLIDSVGDACSGTDQRGASRPDDGDEDGLSACDVGAVEVGSAACIPDAETLCLRGGRFRVTAQWQTPQEEGTAKSVPLTAETGAFWFFNAENLELMIKVLDGCDINDRFWVFMTGLTDVSVQILVDDTFTGHSWSYGRTGGEPIPAVTDTNAFASCP